MGRLFVESAESDNRCQQRKVHGDRSGQTLHIEAVNKVGFVERQFATNIRNEATKYSITIPYSFPFSTRTCPWL
jgi:hypothetical protein